MSRFFRAPQTQDIDYVVQPAAGGAGGPAGGMVGEGGDIFDQIQVLDEHAPQYQERVDQYRQQIDEYARMLQQDPNAYAQIAPKVQQLQRSVMDDLKRGPISHMRQRFGEVTDWESRVADTYKNNPTIGRYYANLARAGVDIDPANPFTGPALAPDWTTQQMVKKMNERAQAFPEDYVTDLAGQVRGGQIRFQDVERRTREDIASFLEATIVDDPQFQNWMKVMSEVEGQDYAEIMGGMVEEIVDKMSKEKVTAVTRKLPTDRAASAAQQRQQEIDDMPVYNAVAGIIYGDLGIEELDWYGKDDPNLSMEVVATEYLSGESLTPGQYWDPEEGKLVDANKSAVERASQNWVNEIFGETGEDVELSLTMGSVIRIPPEAPDQPVDAPASFPGYPSATTLKRGESYIEVYPTQEAYDRRDDPEYKHSKIYIRLTPLNATRLLQQFAGAQGTMFEHINKVIADKYRDGDYHPVTGRGDPYPRAEPTLMAPLDVEGEDERLFPQQGGGQQPGGFNPNSDIRIQQ